MQRRKVIISGTFAAVLIAVAVVLIQGLWWYVGFRERLQLADEHAPIVRAALQGDGRFLEINVQSFTASNGSLLVEAVSPSGTASELEAIVGSTSPPVPVRYHITEKNVP